MSGLSRDYLAIYVQMLRFALTQQLEFTLSRHDLVLPSVGHRPSFKAQLLAASNYSGLRSGREKAKTASLCQCRSPQYGRVDGALP